MSGFISATMQQQMMGWLTLLGNYWAHVILYSFASVLLVQALKRLWRTRSPGLNAQLGFLSMVLPVIAMFAYGALFGGQNSVRSALAIIRVDGWANLAASRQAWLIWFVVPVALLTALPFAIEGIAALVRQWRTVGLPSQNAPLIQKADEAAQAVQSRAGFATPVIVVQRDEPLAWVRGLMRPAIMLSEPLVDLLDSEELEAVLAHEQAHVKRGDAWLSYASFVVRTLLLFNPAVTYTYWQIAAHAEQACDQLALRWTGRRVALASALLKAYRAGHGRVPEISEVVEDVRLSVRLWEGLARRTLLQERLEHILHDEPVPSAESARAQLIAASGAILGVLFFVG